MEPDIPKDQLARLQPVVESLLADLRSRTRNLPAQTPLALVYVLGSDNNSEPQAHP